MQKIIVIGKHGKVKDIHYLTNQADNYLKKISPLIEIDTDYVAERSVVMGGFKNEKEEKAYLTRLAEEQFKDWGRCGHFKDAMQITKREIGLDGGKVYEYSIDFIGRLELEKTMQAADILIFVNDLSGNLFLVGITRKENPGKDEFALVGGKRDFVNDKNGYYEHYETPVETIIHEAKEEAGLTLKLCRHEKKKARTDLNARSFDVIVELKGRSAKKRRIPAKLELVGSFQTAEDKKGKKIAENGKAARVKRKRIDETIAFMVVINTASRKLTKEKIAGWFTAGDDAKAIVVVDLQTEKTLDFAFGHHADIFKEAFSPAVCAKSGTIL